MLVISRKRGQGVQIGPEIFLRILEVRGERIRLGIDAPAELTVLRQELIYYMGQCNLKATQLDRDRLQQLSLELELAPSPPPQRQAPRPLGQPALPNGQRAFPRHALPSALGKAAYSPFPSAVQK